MEQVANPALSLSKGLITPKLNPSITLHSSLFTIHYSLFTIHSSPLEALAFMSLYLPSKTSKRANLHSNGPL